MAADQGRTLAKTRTDASGGFALTLPRGVHVITAYNVAGYRSSASATVTVGPSPIDVTLTVDSGIR